MKIGYGRVSTLEQNLEAQIDALEAAGCEKIYTDKISGTKATRPGLEEMERSLRQSDVIVVQRLDRLGRSLKDLIALVEKFAAMGVQLISLSEGIDTTTPTGKLMFHLFGAIAEFERNLIRERTKASLLAARARGRVGGRAVKFDNKFIMALDRFIEENPQLLIEECCKKFNIASATYYRRRKEIFAQREVSQKDS